MNQATLIMVGLVLQLCSVAQIRAGMVIGYTDRAAFDGAAQPQFQWGFDGIFQGDTFNNYQGPNGIVLTSALGTNDLFSNQLQGFSGGELYFGSGDRDLIFTAPTYSFGINVAWAPSILTNNGWTPPVGVTMDVYAYDGSLLGSVSVTTADAYAGPVLGTGTPFYAAFLGVVSDTPIEGIYFNDIPGAAFYDNAEWGAALAVPEPSTLVLIGTAFFTGLGYIGLRRRKLAVAEYASKQAGPITAS